MSTTDYPVENNPIELERLEHQGKLLEPATRVLLQSAGIRAGMRVLDLGSGAGDVSFLAADLVGADGEVVGIDASAGAVATATMRAERRSLHNVRFATHDIHEPAGEGEFDAIVGRLVLMYSPDPAGVLRTHAAALRPGGIVAPVEIDVCAGGSEPTTPLVTQALAWIAQGFWKNGIEAALGPRLWSVLEQAGLKPHGMLAVQPYFGPNDPDAAAELGGVVRAAAPLMERAGVATAIEIGADTIEQRIADELRTASAVFAFPPLVCAWGTR